MKILNFINYQLLTDAKKYKNFNIQELSLQVNLKLLKFVELLNCSISITDKYHMIYALRIVSQKEFLNFKNP